MFFSKSTKAKTQLHLAPTSSKKTWVFLKMCFSSVNSRKFRFSASAFWFTSRNSFSSFSNVACIGKSKAVHMPSNCNNIMTQGWPHFFLCSLIYYDINFVFMYLWFIWHHVSSRDSRSSNVERSGHDIIYSTTLASGGTQNTTKKCSHDSQNCSQTSQWAPSEYKSKTRLLEPAHPKIADMLQTCLQTLNKGHLESQYTWHCGGVT
jgi:hypothetical protein